MAKWTAKKDFAADKKAGVKQGSKKDIALDKKRGVSDQKQVFPKGGKPVKAFKCGGKV